MQFRLCPVNNKLKKATQRCLDQNILQLVDSNGIKVGTTKAGPVCCHVLLNSQMKSSEGYSTGDPGGAEWKPKITCIGGENCHDLSTNIFGGTTPTQCFIIGFHAALSCMI